MPMTAAVIKESLRSVSLFSELSDAELDTVASTSRSVTAKKGARIFEEGTPADCCYVLTSGRAKLVLSAEGGTEIILGVLNPKAIVGEVALLDHSNRSADLIATEESHFIRIPKASFDALRRNFRFEERVVVHAMSLLRGANDQLRGLFSLPSVSRVAWCLARLARQEGRRKGAKVTIPKRPHQELAEMIGCQRETVTRALKTLEEKKKCISYEGETIVLDVEGLQRVLHRDLQID